jgi:hypothetical protein
VSSNGFSGAASECCARPVGQRKRQVNPDDLLRAVVEEVLDAHAEDVARRRRGEPGAWGRLAGFGVVAYRRRLGRRLADQERRAIWAALWAALEARHARAGPPSQ